MCVLGSVVIFCVSDFLFFMHEYLIDGFDRCQVWLLV